MDALWRVSCSGVSCIVHNLCFCALMILALPTYTKEEWVDLRLQEFLATRARPPSKKFTQKYKLRIERKYDAALELVNRTDHTKHKHIDMLYLLLSSAFMIASEEEFEDHIKRALQNT